MEFNTALQNWLDAVKKNVIDPQLNDEWLKNHNIADYMRLSVKPGTKFLRIISQNHNCTGASCWAFVAMADGQNKALGAYRKGDIFKSAGWTTPAKHARGNIFENADPCCGIKQWTGPDYLRF